MAADRPSGDFGSTLRQARERRGISLRQIANATKITVSALEALERNDISRLPGGIFSRAFVRSYAVEVGLDPEATIQDFVAHFPHDSVTAGHPTSAPVEDTDGFESNRRAASTFVGLIAISVPVIGALLYFGVVGRQTPDGAAPATEIAPVAPDARVPDSSEASPPVPADSPSTNRAPIPTDLSPPGGSVTATATAAAPASVAPGATSAAPPPATRDLAGAPAAEERLTVGVSVKRPCYVSATVDGQKSIERLLQPGEQRTIEVKREMALTAADASAITITLNGLEAKSLGRPGEVVTVHFNLANFKGYLQTR